MKTSILAKNKEKGKLKTYYDTPDQTRSFANVHTKKYNNPDQSHVEKSLKPFRGN